MGAISNRMPTVWVSYDGPNGDRLRKRFTNPYEARSFYVGKSKRGWNPQVESDARGTAANSDKLAEHTRKAILDLELLLQAIDEGRAYLNTYVGVRKVVSYNAETGDTVTNNRGDFYDRRSFCVCAGGILIGEIVGEPTIQLANDPPQQQPARFENIGSRQQDLWIGRNDLPGQSDLIDESNLGD